MARPRMLRWIRRHLPGGRARVAPPTSLRTEPGRPDDGRMTGYDVLAAVHERVAPRTYLEIGVNLGRSLTLSRATSVAVDPDFKITVPIRCDLDLIKATSDEFFAMPDPLAHLRRATMGPGAVPGNGSWAEAAAARPPLDMAFIDGLHHFEFALRDLINVERHADWWTVIVIDDVLPRNALEANRERTTQQWAGDVFKILPVLAAHRPDLIVLPLDTWPTGVAVILGADPTSSVLSDRYDTIAAEFVVPDPQTVPPSTLDRVGALDARAALEAALWPALLDGRRAGLTRQQGIERLRQAVAELRPTPIPV